MYLRWYIENLTRNVFAQSGDDEYGIDIHVLNVYALNLIIVYYPVP